MNKTAGLRRGLSGLPLETLSGMLPGMPLETLSESLSGLLLESLFELPPFIFAKGISEKNCLYSWAKFAILRKDQDVFEHILKETQGDFGNTPGERTVWIGKYFQ